MFEVEIKAYLDDITSVENRLKNLGATYRKTIQQVDIYFQHPIRNFAKTDEALRIRISDNKSYLTYKGPKIDTSSKTREELEIEIQDHSKLLTLLRKIGFFPVIEVKKSRKCYLFKDIIISLDSVKCLGDFIELEIGVADKKSINDVKSRLLSLLKQLKIPQEKLERRSYLELLLLPKKQRKSE